MGRMVGYEQPIASAGCTTTYNTQVEMRITSSGSGGSNRVTILPAKTVQTCDPEEAVGHDCLQTKSEVTGCIKVTSEANEKCITIDIDNPTIDIEPDDEPPQDAGCTEPSNRPNLEVVSIDGSSGSKEITDNSIVEIIDTNYEDGCTYKCWGADTSHLRLWLPDGVADDPNVSNEQTCEFLNNGVVINNGDGTFKWYVQDILIGKAYSMFTRVECGEKCISDYGQITLDSSDETPQPILSIVEKEVEGDTVVEVTIDNFSEGFVYEDDEFPIKYVGNQDTECFTDLSAYATRVGNTISWRVPQPICDKPMVFTVSISAKDGEKNRSDDGSATIIVDGVPDGMWICATEKVDGSKQVYKGTNPFSYAYMFENNLTLKKVHFAKLSTIVDYGVQTQMFHRSFYGCHNLEEILFTAEFDENSYSSFNDTFSSCYALKKLILPDTATVVNWASAFRYAFALEEVRSTGEDGKINELNLSGATGSVWGLFENCSVLPDITITGLENVSGIPYWFINCHALKYISLQGTTDTLTDLSNTFVYCSTIEIIEPFYQEKVTNLYRTFYGCHRLLISPLSSLGLATDMNGTFWLCYDLQSVPSDYDYSNVTDMRYTFVSCRSLTYMPYVNNDSCPNMDWTWSDCSSLSKVGGLACCSNAQPNTTWSGTLLQSFPCN